MEAIKDSTGALEQGILGVAIISALTFTLGEVTGNASFVDKAWTTLPLFYSAFFTLKGGIPSRMFLVLFLQSLWWLRLTRHSYKRGFYSWKYEDYRWEIVRNKLTRIQFTLLNFVFISIIQNILLFSIELPQLVILNRPYTPLNAIDLILAVAFLAVLAIEYLADEQQQAFQTEKHARKGAGVAKSSDTDSSLERAEFITSGLWAYSRHPNFAAEQTIWWIIYLFSVLPYHGIQHVNWSIVGPLLMNGLFLSSTPLTEAIMKNKYPLYVEYQKSVPMFWPWLSWL